jgi:hypothetical protein
LVVNTAGVVVDEKNLVVSVAGVVVDEEALRAEEDAEATLKRGQSLSREAIMGVVAAMGHELGVAMCGPPCCCCWLNNLRMGIT